MLQNLASAASFDLMYLEVLKRLRQSTLPKKEDIRQYDLLSWSCRPASKEKFEYLVDWDPKVLKEYDYRGHSLLHSNTRRSDTFGMALKAGLKYYPQELGFLFRKNSNGKTAYEFAFKCIGKGKAWRTIHTCFEETVDGKIVERDPETNLYPFMIAAAGKTSELNSVYYLLRNPVVFAGVNQVLAGFDPSCVGRKRTRVS